MLVHINILSHYFNTDPGNQNKLYKCLFLALYFNILSEIGIHNFSIFYYISHGRELLYQVHKKIFWSVCCLLVRTVACPGHVWGQQWDTSSQAVWCGGTGGGRGGRLQSRRGAVPRCQVLFSQWRHWYEFYNFQDVITFHRKIMNLIFLKLLLLFASYHTL